MNKAYKEYQEACNELKDTAMRLGDALYDLQEALADHTDVLEGMNQTAAKIDWESVEEEMKSGLDRKGDK